MVNNIFSPYKHNYTFLFSGTQSEQECLEKKKIESNISSRGVIPQAKIRTVKMTLVIVLSKSQFCLSR